MSLFAWVLVAAAVGVALGTVTGLIPGLHVNNVAIILLALVPVLVEGLEPLVGDGTLVLVAAAIVSMSLTHTFLDFIPGCFLGAPEEDVALSVLPAHAMLLEGKGVRAVALSALGSFGAVLTACVLIVPFRLLIGPPVELYALVSDHVVYGVVAIAVLLILTTTTRPAYRRGIVASAVKMAGMDPKKLGHTKREGGTSGPEEGNSPVTLTGTVATRWRGGFDLALEGDG